MRLGILTGDPDWSISLDQTAQSPATAALIQKYGYDHCDHGVSLLTPCRKCQQENTGR